MKRWVLALAALVVAGCDPSFERVVFSETSVPPLSATVLPSTIQVTRGVAVRTVATPYNDDDEVMEGTVGLVSGNGSVLTILPAEDKGFVLVGVGNGSTFVAVTLDGRELTRIPAAVFEPNP